MEELLPALAWPRGMLSRGWYPGNSSSMESLYCLPLLPKPARFPPLGSAQLQEHLWTLHWAKLDDELWAPGVSQPT